MKLTHPTTLVLEALARGARYGFDVIDRTELPSGTVYPILRRLERDGCALGRWEDVAIAQDERRPPRRYYELTAAGRALLAEARQRQARNAATSRTRTLRPERSS